MNQQDIRELRVGDIMQADWATRIPEQNVEDVIKLISESGISGAPVVEDGRLVGIVTEDDLIYRDAQIRAPGFFDILGGIIPLGDWDEYHQEALKSAGVTVGEVMTREVATVGPDTPLAEAATIMAERRVKILPVAEQETLRGVVTRMDILTLHVLNPRR